MGSTAEDTGEDVDLTEFPPYAIGAIFLTVGSFTIYTFWNAENTFLPLFGAGALLVGITPLSTRDICSKQKIGNPRGTSSAPSRRDDVQ